MLAVRLRGVERHTQLVTHSIAWGSGLAHCAQRTTGHPLTEEVIVRNALVTVQLMKQARNAAIAQAEAEERLKQHVTVMRRTEPAKLGWFPHVVTLAHRVRILASRAI
jgi:hypothetical protein